MAFHWRADDGPFIAVFGSPIPSSIKKQQEKNPIKFGPPLKKLSGSGHDTKYLYCGPNVLIPLSQRHLHCPIYLLS